MDKQRFGSRHEPGSTAVRARGAASQRQRASIRKALPCTLHVRIGASHILTQSVHDLSLTGVFVQTDPTGVAIGDRAEVLIGFVDHGGRPREHRIGAEVVRVQPRGIGLRFDQYGNRAYTDLVNYLY
jgi:hypothetical protein